MLDQIALARAILAGVRQEFSDHVELVIARPNLRCSLLSGLWVLELDDLGVVLKDVGQTLSGQNAFPKIIALEPVRVGWVSRAVVPALVERQEPGCLTLEMCAKTHFVFVQREVRDAPAELEKFLARIAVALVLLNGVFDRLLGEAVLQLERRDRQAVDEESQIEGKLRLVAAITQLPRDAEAIGVVAFLCLFIARRRRSVEEVEMMRAMLDPIAQ